MALGPCGCEEYHLADCPLLTGDPQDAPEPEDMEYDFLRDDVDLEGQGLFDD